MIIARLFHLADEEQKNNQCNGLQTIQWTESH